MHMTCLEASKRVEYHKRYCPEEATSGQWPRLRGHAQREQRKIYSLHSLLNRYCLISLHTCGVAERNGSVYVVREQSKVRAWPVVAWIICRSHALAFTDTHESHACKQACLCRIIVLSLLVYSSILVMSECVHKYCTGMRKTFLRLSCSSLTYG
jgi:hypothetical protein